MEIRNIENLKIEKCKFRKSKNVIKYFTYERLGVIIETRKIL